MPGRTKKHLRRSPLAVRLGTCIRDTRTRRNLTQEKLAEKASLSKNYVGNIERGEYDVTVSTLHRVATALGMTAGDLLKAAGV